MENKAHLSSDVSQTNSGQRPIELTIVDSNPLVIHGLTYLLLDTNFHVMTFSKRLCDLPAREYDDLEQECENIDRVLLLGLGNDAEILISDLLQWKPSHKNYKVIVLSECFKIDEVVTVMKAGASCYLEKSQINRAVLLMSLDLVLQGTLVLSGQFANEVTQDQIVGARPLLTSADPGLIPESTITQSADMNEPGGLSDRQRVVLSHLMRGASNKHIANALGIAEATVKVHVKGLLRKIQVKNRTQAAMWGRDAHRVDPMHQVKMQLVLPPGLALLGQVSTLLFAGAEIFL